MREVYKFEKIKLTHEIYDLNESFTDIKFVMSISFKDISSQELADLTRITAKDSYLAPQNILTKKLKNPRLFQTSPFR